MTHEYLCVVIKFYEYALTKLTTFCLHFFKYIVTWNCDAETYSIIHVCMYVYGALLVDTTNNIFYDVIETHFWKAPTNDRYGGLPFRIMSALNWDDIFIAIYLFNEVINLQK